MMMMMVLCPTAGSLAFTPPGDEMSEEVSRCLPHRQLWVSNLSKVATRWLEVDSKHENQGINRAYTELYLDFVTAILIHYFNWHLTDFDSADNLRRSIFSADLFLSPFS